MRLDKFLTKCFVGSRSDVKKFIKQKTIKVNDKIITNESFNVNELNDIVSYNDLILTYKEHYYFILNKPSGYISSTNDPINKTVIELFKDLPLLLQKELFPVGRLDKDTEGLLLVTNDGDFAHKLTSPNYHVNKKYYFEYEGTLIDNAQILVKEGIKTENEIFLPGILEPINEKSAYISISEGKYHQVKKMTHELGVILTYLKRIQIGSIELPTDLEIGKYTEIDEETIKKQAFNE